MSKKSIIDDRYEMTVAKKQQRKDIKDHKKMINDLYKAEKMGNRKNGK